MNLCYHGIIHVPIAEEGFHDIFEETKTLKAKYYEFGIHLGLPPHELDTIREQFPHGIAQAFAQVLLLWLRQSYNVERYGPPTWQALVKAVEQENRALAKTIAAKYLCTGNCLFSRWNPHKDIILYYANHHRYSQLHV